MRTISCCQENFVTKIFMIIVKFTKIMKIFNYGNLELYDINMEDKTAKYHCHATSNSAVMSCHNYVNSYHDIVLILVPCHSSV